jgi:hypothetical protein
VPPYARILHIQSSCSPLTTSGPGVVITPPTRPAYNSPMLTHGGGGVDAWHLLHTRSEPQARGLTIGLPGERGTQKDNNPGTQNTCAVQRPTASSRRVRVRVCVCVCGESTDTQSRLTRLHTSTRCQCCGHLPHLDQRLPLGHLLGCHVVPCLPLLALLHQARQRRSNNLCNRSV